MYSSLFSPFGVYSAYSFVGDYIFPHWGVYYSSPLLGNYIYSHLGNIRRQTNNLFSTLNGTFLSDKESKIELDSREFSKSKIVAWKFHVLTGKNISYDVIMGHDLMKELQMDVLYSEYVVVWDGVRLPMQKIQNVKWMDLHLMHQEDTEAIKDQFTRLGRIIDYNNKKI